MTRLRKHEAEALVAALESATSGPLEEITMVRDRIAEALRIVLDRPAAGWVDLVAAAAGTEGWEADRTARLMAAADPSTVPDPEDLLWALWDLVTELNERRDLG